MDKNQMLGRKKKLPIGVDNFEKIRTDGFYYVDKTGLIRDLLNNWGEVNLFTRPRRFGKSLNFSMLKAFFEPGCRKELFAGLAIEQEKTLCEEYMGKIPVIAVSLKDVDGNNFSAAREMLYAAVRSEALRFPFLEESSRLSPAQKALYSRLTGPAEASAAGDALLMESLKILSSLLGTHYGQKVLILIDEYDVPLARASEKGYYDLMVSLIRNLFSAALKSNENLYFAVLTGCLRVAKESIFTGMNNLKVLSVQDVRFDEYYGFTDEEVRMLLEYYGLSEHNETIRDWYDGYQFGGLKVYCPWDVLSYCDELRADPEAEPKDYWSNTSSNDVVRHLIQCAENVTVRREIERLVAGETVWKEIHPELTYKELYSSIENIWSVLFTTGYLTQRGKAEEDRYCLAIPNMEIRRIFTRQIMAWFQENVSREGEMLAGFCGALQNGDAGGVERYLSAYLRKTVSIRDTFAGKSAKENFYHGMILRLLRFKDSWRILSNREAGEGYADIQVEIDEAELGIVIEVKYAHDGDLDAGCRRGLDQIVRKHYGDGLYENGMKRVLMYGICFYRNKCRVMVLEEKMTEDHDDAAKGGDR